MLGNIIFGDFFVRIQKPTRPYIAHVEEDGYTVRRACFFFFLYYVFLCCSVHYFCCCCDLFVCFFNIFFWKLIGLMLIFV